ncbi:MAG: transcription antitermination factor NusB [Ignavibacterium sp.]|uniref:transcription antitermination factor NusB n=1 Tax=Ignavibacterium album TaxID=591197 RepID=UPI0026E9E2CC|nr:transcription antitermination factor NusB [Ignavibacterium album]MCA2004816.1 transcription antitermination factor NusB [Ignavibacterium sp.]MCX8106150.1 transcription antitermination factor NusB [Ignavibacterium album]
MTKVFKRRLIREKVLQVLYAYEMNNDNLQTQIDEIFSDVEEGNDKQFGLSLIYKVIPNREKFDEMIKSKVSNWEMDRIAMIDKILLRMGICELLYFEDIPPKVSINEVIEISKNFSTAGSGKFINGVLDAILNDLKKSGELKKAGRGLVDETISKKSIKKSE